MTTCIDHFSKTEQLISLQEFDTLTMAEKILRIVVTHHGLLECIKNECDTQFCGHFWDELMFLFDNMLTFIMAPHPQTDGIAEVMNHTMEQVLYIHI